MSGDHNMHQKPDALELAAALEWPFSGHELKQQAAAKLRRLQAENEALQASLVKARKLESATGLALEVLEKHRQMKGEYPMGMLGVRAAEEIKEAFREIREATFEERLE